MGRLILALLLLGCPPAFAGLEVRDTFTEVSDTNLTSHTADTGGSWTSSGVAGALVVSGADDLLYSTAAGTTRARESAGVGTPDMVVRAGAGVAAAATGVAGVGARVAADFSAGYFCYYEWDGASNYDLILVSRSGGVNTELDTLNINHTLDTEHDLQLSVIGGIIRCCSDSTCMPDAADTAVATGNNAGVIFQGNSNSWMGFLNAYTYTRGKMTE